MRAETRRFKNDYCYGQILPIFTRNSADRKAQPALIGAALWRVYDFLFDKVCEE